MKYKVLMQPDYGNALFWDEEGCCIGGCDSFSIGVDGNEITIDLSGVNGLKKWFQEWDSKTLYPTTPWTDEQWRDWWEQGLEFAKTVNQLLPADVELSYFSLNNPVWKAKPEESNDGGLFNLGDPITLLKPGIYDFKCCIMPWTAHELGLDSDYSIKVTLYLSYIDIQDIVDMMKWAWVNNWFEHSTSETVSTKLLQNRLPGIYDKVHPKAHEIFCTNFPNSDHIEGFGVYEIFSPTEIIEFAAFSCKDYYLK